MHVNDSERARVWIYVNLRVSDRSNQMSGAGVSDFHHICQSTDYCTILNFEIFDELTHTSTLINCSIIRADFLNVSCDNFAIAKGKVR